MASKSTASKTTTEEAPALTKEQKNLIDRIAEKIKTDKNLSKNLQQVAPDELQTNLSDAIEGAVKALDDDEWEKKYKPPPMNWDRPPRYVEHAVNRTGLYDYEPRSPARPSAALIEAVYAKHREKPMAQEVLHKRLSLDKATEAGVAGNIRKFLGGKRTRKRRRRRRMHKRSKRRSTRRRRKTKRKRRRTRRR